MDRLVCGDVGFGKTEIALRAAFAAAMNGVQVAVVVPTTLLARQHYQTFCERFRGFPLKIGHLSRLTGQTAARKTREALAAGDLDIVIGTHALLSKSVRFAHLGLMIVDEEQRFGVRQKERLKKIRENVHVLAMSATPIPRTLQLALSGVRELSLIATPPVDRLAVRSFVLPEDPVVLREAILREHWRGGQVFYVAPRIKYLDTLRARLAEMVPEVKLVTATGQMAASELEEVMTAFDARHYDVLLATNIIESGLDIPNANTLIVHRADMFSLAQLYQLRGRVGRGKQRGYAYLTWEPRKPLTAVAQQRLHILETLDTLGAGFNLASHDLDMRGAGNLLGEEQSGHVKEVGIELYQQMLEEAVVESRAESEPGVGPGAGAAPPDRSWTPQINLGTPVLIPDRYVPDLNVRLSLYRRVAELEDRAEIDAFAAELIDRFGPLPGEVQNLLDVITVKQLCRQAHVERVEAGPKGAVVRFRDDTPPDVAAVMGYVADQAGTVKIRPDQKLACIRHWPSTAARVEGVTRLMQDLAGLAQKQAA